MFYNIFRSRIIKIIAVPCILPVLTENPLIYYSVRLASGPVKCINITRKYFVPFATCTWQACIPNFFLRTLIMVLGMFKQQLILTDVCM
jgi:hypothetical protein